VGQALEAFVKSRVDSEDRVINMTIQLSNVENEMVKFWAKKFGMSKRKFLADLVMAAIKDIEAMCELDPKEREEYDQIISDAAAEDVYSPFDPVYDED